MPVPSNLSDLSQTPGSNSPAGSENPNTTDDYLRTISAFLAQVRDGKNLTDPVTLASATTTDIGGQNSFFVEISGTTTITSFGTNYNGPRFLRFTGALILTHNATTLNLPGAANITTAAGDTCIAVPNVTPNGWNIVQYQRAANVPGVADTATTATTATNIAGGVAGAIPYQTGSGATSFSAAGTAGQVLTSQGTSAPTWGRVVLRGYIDGLTMSTAGSSTTMTIAAGDAANSTNAFLMQLSSSINKTTSSWAVGSGNGGLDTGTIANSTWYYFYLIRRPDTGVVDVVFSTNSTSPTLPTNYTQFRYIGAGLTNGSGQWTRFFQTEDEFWWETPVLDINAAGSTSAQLATLSVPRGRKVKVFANVTSGTQMQVYLSDPANADVAPSNTAAPLATIMNTGTTLQLGAQATVWTNTSAQIRRRESNTNNFSLVTLGWLDLRGRNT